MRKRFAPRRHFVGRRKFRHWFNLHGICLRCGISIANSRNDGPRLCSMRVTPRREGGMGPRQGWSRLGREIDRLRRRGLINDALHYVIVDGHAKPNRARPAGWKRGDEL